MTVQAIAGVTGAISFSGVGVGEGSGGGGPYWGAQLAVATNTKSEIMAEALAGRIGLRECVADRYKSWRSDYPVGKPGHAGS